LFSQNEDPVPFKEAVSLVGRECELIAVNSSGHCRSPCDFPPVVKIAVVREDKFTQAHQAAKGCQEHG
jgi:hypothetical protein